MHESLTGRVVLRQPRFGRYFESPKLNPSKSLQQLSFSVITRIPTSAKNQPLGY